MLGRLRMSTDDAMKCYEDLASKVFSKSKQKSNGMFKATLFESALKQLISNSTKGYTGEEGMMSDEPSTKTGKMYGSL